MKDVPTVILLSLAALSCYVEPKVHVEGCNPPQFTFSSNTVTTTLFVSRIPPESRNGMIPIEFFSKDNPNTYWMIDGKHDQVNPIAYRKVPEGMREVIAAKPLVEGENYFVFVASLVGRSFVIEGGCAKEDR